MARRVREYCFVWKNNTYAFSLKNIDFFKTLDIQPALLGVRPGADPLLRQPPPDAELPAGVQEEEEWRRSRGSGRRGGKLPEVPLGGKRHVQGILFFKKIVGKKQHFCTGGGVKLQHVVTKLLNRRPR